MHGALRRNQTVMTLSRNIYNPQEAAKFLGVTEAELRQLTQQRDVTQRSFKGTTFYLGGELDCVLRSVQQKLGNNYATSL